jgi:hypothetical protein
MPIDTQRIDASWLTRRARLSQSDLARGNLTDS